MKLLLFVCLVLAIGFIHEANAQSCESSFDCPDEDHPDNIFCCDGECCSMANLTETSLPTASGFRSWKRKIKREMYIARVIGFSIMGIVIFGFCCFCGTCCYCIFRKKKRRGTVLQPPAPQTNDSNAGYAPAPTYPPNYPPGGGSYPPAGAYPPVPSYNVAPAYPSGPTMPGAAVYPPETKDGAPLFPPTSTGAPVYPPSASHGAVPTYPPTSGPGAPTYPPTGAPAYPGYPPTSSSSGGPPGYPPASDGGGAPYPPNQPPPTYSEYPSQPAFNPNT